MLVPRHPWGAPRLVLVQVRAQLLRKLLLLHEEGVGQLLLLPQQAIEQRLQLRRRRVVRQVQLRACENVRA